MQRGRHPVQRIEREQVAAAQSAAPQRQRVQRAGQQRDVPGAQGERTAHLHRVEHLVGGDEQQQMPRDRPHRGVVGVQRDDFAARAADQRGQQQAQRERGADAAHRRVPRAGVVAGAQALRDQRARRDRQRQRRHVQQRSQAGGDLVRGQRALAQVRDEQCHAGERGDFEQHRGADRQSQAKQLPLSGQAGEVPAQRGELAQRPAMLQHRGAQQQPLRHAGGERAAQRAQSVETMQAERARGEQQRVEREFDEQRAELQHGDEQRSRDRLRQRDMGAEQQRRRQRQRLHAQIAEHVRVIGVAAEREQWLRPQQQRDAGQRQRHGQPQALTEHRAQTARVGLAVRARQHRKQCLHRFGQRDVQRDVDRLAQRQRRQTRGVGAAAEHRGVGHAETDHGDLADENRTRQAQQRAQRAAVPTRGVAHGPSSSNASSRSPGRWPRHSTRSPGGRGASARCSR
ncbi:hypothetical protein GALL_347250 [mine drainage metagenome]|uniref:Uncharacterized protein n=1 Tax=mine drainage metagenome TaxID=410659 RepID=A0A1J5QJ03_9ZZZZ